MSVKFQRILLKLSGEAFKGARDYGIDPQFLTFIAQEISLIHSVVLKLPLLLVVVIYFGDCPLLKMAWIVCPLTTRVCWPL